MLLIVDRKGYCSASGSGLPSTSRYAALLYFVVVVVDNYPTARVRVDVGAVCEDGDVGHLGRFIY